MANPSSLQSSSHHRPPSAFQWPLPPQSELELTIKEILDVYQHDPELLKLVLSAKAEEDKKLAARNTLQVEQARIQQRVMDLDMLRVYHRLPSSMIDNGIQQQHATATTTTTTTTTHPHPPPGAVVYAPLQQQVIARITEAHSPVGAYPHSAHPLCSDYARYPQHPPPPQQPPPTTTSQQQQQHRAPLPPQQQQQQQSSSTSRLLSKDNVSATTTTTTSSSPPSKKRPRSSNEKMSHDMVMEALKAKLQRTQQAEAAEKKKRARTLPKPLVTVVKQQQQQQQQSDSASASPIMPSPRSAKPVLPPIDTSVGRLQASRGPMSSPYIQRLPPFSAAIAQKNNNHHYHPSRSDTTKRRVRSLSPPPFANAH